MDRRLRRGRRPGGGGRYGLRGDREPRRPVHRDDARVSRGPPARGRRANRGHHRGGHRRGQGIAVAYAHWVAALGYNGLGRYADALAAATKASEDTSTLYISMWALPELIEAAVRSGNAHFGTGALERL